MKVRYGFEPVSKAMIGQRQVCYFLGVCNAEDEEWGDKVICVFPDGRIANANYDEIEYGFNECELQAIYLVIEDMKD